MNRPGLLKPFNGLAESLMRLFDRTLGRLMFLFVIAGVVLSCMHQSSLGVLLVLAPDKMHPLWYTRILPLQFLLSAIAVGFPMVIFESWVASRSFRRKPEMDLLAPLSRIIPVLLFVYLGVKVTDLAIRGAFPLLFEGSLESGAYLAEVLIGVVAPLLLLLFEKVRRSPNLLFTSAVLVVLGVVMNRINVYLIAYRPVYMTERYLPAIGEVAVPVGLISGLMFVYRFLVNVLPVLPAEATSAPAAGIREAQPWEEIHA